MKSLFSHPQEEGLYGIFNDSYPPIIDGVTITVQNYARWLKANGRIPCIVTPWNPKKIEEGTSVMRFLSLPIHNRKPYRYGYPKLDPFIWTRLRKTNFKILHSHCPFSSGRLAVYVKKHQKVPLIGTFHSKYKSDLSHSFKHLPWCVPIIMKRILNFFNACDEVWIPQPQVEETVRAYGYKGKLEVVENGNDFEMLLDGDLKTFKKEAAERLNFNRENLNLLFVGQHILEKGVDTIIDVVSKLSKDIRVKMNFIGTGYATPEMNKLIKEKGLTNQIELKGLITDRSVLKDYYAASDLFIFPSFYDNAPLVIREAAAMGTPSIILKGSTASEVIKDNYNGYLVNKDADQISQRIRQILLDKESMLQTGFHARETLVRSWEDVVGEVIDRYETLIRKHGRNG